MTEDKRDQSETALPSALKNTQPLYPSLFAGINSGFCIVEVDLNALSGRAARIDYRVVDANAAFYEQTGFPQAIFGQ